MTTYTTHSLLLLYCAKFSNNSHLYTTTYLSFFVDHPLPALIVVKGEYVHVKSLGKEMLLHINSRLSCTAIGGSGSQLSFVSAFTISLHLSTDPNPSTPSSQSIAYHQCSPSANANLTSSNLSKQFLECSSSPLSSLPLPLWHLSKREWKSIS